MVGEKYSGNTAIAYLYKKHQHPLCVDSCAFQNHCFDSWRAQVQDQCTGHYQDRWDLGLDQSELWMHGKSQIMQIIFRKWK